MGLLAVIILLGLLGLKLENFNKKAETTKVYVLKKTNTTDQHFLGYFSLFVLFAITFDLSKVSMLVVFILILVMIGIVYVKNKLFYINPFLNIFGYNFYDITFREFGSKEEKTIKIFFKGDLVLEEQYTLTTKDENFSFLKEKKNSNK